MIVDNSSKSKAEIISSLNKGNQINDYQQLVLTEQEEANLYKGVLSVRVVSGQLTKVVMSPPQNMPEINKEKLAALLATAIGKSAKDITEQDILTYIDNNPLDKALIKWVLLWMLYQSRSQGSLQ